MKKALFIPATLIVGLFFQSETCAREKSGAKSKSPNGEALWVTPRREPEGTKYKTFQSKTIQGPVSYLIYLPPDYEKNTRRRYPCLYWLHGGMGNPIKGAAFVKLVDGEIRENKVPPLIVVLVNGLPMSMYIDSVDGKQPVESVIIKAGLFVLKGGGRVILRGGAFFSRQSGRFLMG